MQQQSNNEFSKSDSWKLAHYAAFLYSNMLKKNGSLDEKDTFKISNVECKSGNYITFSFSWNDKKVDVSSRFKYTYSDDYICYVQIFSRGGSGPSNSFDVKKENIREIILKNRECSD